MRTILGNWKHLPSSALPFDLQPRVWGEFRFTKREKGAARVTSQEKVLKWFKELMDMFLRFAKRNESVTGILRRPSRQPGRHLSGSTPKYKLDAGFANSAKASSTIGLRSLCRE